MSMFGLASEEAETYQVHLTPLYLSFNTSTNFSWQIAAPRPASAAHDYCSAAEEDWDIALLDVHQ